MRGEILASRYEVLERQGRGGMAVVWRCRDRELGRLVAVKILSTDALRQEHGDEGEGASGLEEALGRFRREADTLKAIRHRGIPEIYETGDWRGDPYIVMRFIDGVSLHEFLRTNTPDIKITASIVTQVLRALQEVHRNKVVHRDLKPLNILIEPTGHVMLIDFGIAKLLDPAATKYTSDGATVGSVGYQAPEQILTSKITEATDLYALGCVLYELLTGRAPFIGDDIRYQHVNRQPDPPSFYNATVPDDVDTLTLRLLAKEATDRPADVQEILNLLSRSFHALAIPARPNRLVPTECTFSQHRRYP